MKETLYQKNNRMTSSRIAQIEKWKAETDDPLLLQWLQNIANRITRRTRTIEGNIRYRNDAVNRVKDYQNASMAKAHNKHKHWSDSDKKDLFESELTDREIAAKMGRTLYSVKSMRSLIKKRFENLPETALSKLS